MRIKIEIVRWDENTELTLTGDIQGTRIMEMTSRGIYLNCGVSLASDLSLTKPDRRIEVEK